VRRACSRAMQAGTPRQLCNLLKHSNVLGLPVGLRHETSFQDGKYSRL
jgi:hypothetical protein